MWCIPLFLRVWFIVTAHSLMKKNKQNKITVNKNNSSHWSAHHTVPIKGLRTRPRKRQKMKNVWQTTSPGSMRFWQCANSWSFSLLRRNFSTCNSLCCTPWFIVPVILLASDHWLYRVLCVFCGARVTKKKRVGKEKKISLLLLWCFYVHMIYKAIFECIYKLLFSFYSVGFCFVACSFH